MASIDLTVEMYEGRDGVLPNIRDEWEKCLSDCPEHQQLFGFEWVSSWLSTLGSEDKWTGESRLFLAYDAQGRLRGVLPFAKCRYRGATFWALAGGFQPVRGFVCHEEVNGLICRAFARAMLKKQRASELYRLGPTDTFFPERAALVNELSMQSHRLVLFAQKPTIVIDDLPRSIEDFERMAKTKSSMKGIRYYQRKAEREGRLKIRHFSNCRGEELRLMLADFSAIESKSWLVTAKSGQPRFLSRSSQSYWESVCSRQLSPRGQLDAWIAYLNDSPAAFLFTIMTGSIRYTIANQYDERFAKYRLGSVLFLEFLRNCAENGVRRVDMGSGDLHYKSQWGGKESEMHYDVLVLPPGFVGYVGAKLLRFEPIYRVAGRALG